MRDEDFKEYLIEKIRVYEIEIERLRSEIDYYEAEIEELKKILQRIDKDKDAHGNTKEAGKK